MIRAGDWGAGPDEPLAATAAVTAKTAAQASRATMAPHTSSLSLVIAASVPGQTVAGQASASICRARAKSLVVSPPAECVDSVSVTVFQLMAMSGWWLAASAR